MVMPDSESHRLREGFDEDATAFDRTRPVCPSELFDDLVRLGNLTTGKQVVEVGAGTGQATRPLAERGLTITAIELGPDLAAVARANLACFESVKVLTGSFEDWQPFGAVFDAVVAFNSLHWVDPELRYTKPARVLRHGGVLVVAGCKWATAAGAQPFWRDVQEDYRAVGAEGEPPPPPEAIGPHHLPPDACVLFEELTALRYPFAKEYTAIDYLANLRTQSVTRELGVEARAEFLARVEARLRRAGWPNLTAAFVGQMTVAKAISPAGEMRPHQESI
jgi:SAM-dependent methyltransferase